MPEQFNVQQHFSEHQQRLLLDLTRRPVTHPGVVGAQSELDWRNMLSAFLPARYCVTSGFAVDIDGHRSEQIDIIVCDRQYSPLFSESNGVAIIPAESVYAAFEVKQSLSKQVFEYAVQKLRSVRELRRTSTDITSIHGVTAGQPAKPIVGGLLARTCDWVPPFGAAFTACLRDAEAGPGRLDIGCALDCGTWVTPFGVLGATEVHEGADALIFFAMHFFALLQQIGTVTALNVRDWLDAAAISGSSVAWGEAG